MKRSRLHELALQAISEGHSVVRTAPRTRTPMRGSNGWKDHSRDASVINQWWTETPHANPAIATIGLVVIDVDLDVPGTLDAWRSYTAKSGADWQTRVIRTPSGGWHLWYRSNAPKFAGIKTAQGRLPLHGRWVETPHIDLISGGPHVPYPGSVTDSGEYCVLEDRPVSPLPDCVAINREPDRVRSRRRGVDRRPVAAARRVHRILEVVLTAPEGNRNRALYWASCQLRDVVATGSLSHPRAVELLADAAERVGLTRPETISTIRSGFRSRPTSEYR